jgi:hypothetical protein
VAAGHAPANETSSVRRDVFLAAHPMVAGMIVGLPRKPRDRIACGFADAYLVLPHINTCLSK